MSGRLSVGGCSHSHDDEKIHAKHEAGHAGQAGAHAATTLTNLRGGQSLPASTRTMFGSRMGYDFSNVRIHTDAHAAQAARSINALAYTHGNNIVFGAGQYAPETRGGQHLLAHELAHVVQQRAGAKQIQRFTAAQCTASTCKPASHCGIVENDFMRAIGYVTDAIFALQETPISAWAERGDSLVFSSRRGYRRRQDSTPPAAHFGRAQHRARGGQLSLRAERRFVRPRRPRLCATGTHRPRDSDPQTDPSVQCQIFWRGDRASAPKF